MWKGQKEAISFPDSSRSLMQPAVQILSLSPLLCVIQAAKLISIVLILNLSLDKLFTANLRHHLPQSSPWPSLSLPKWPLTPYPTDPTDLSFLSYSTSATVYQYHKHSTQHLAAQWNWTSDCACQSNAASVCYFIMYSYSRHAIHDVDKPWIKLKDRNWLGSGNYP